MLAAAALFSLAAAGVHALPVAQLATVEAALSPSNTTHYNETVVNYKQNGNAGACGWYSKDESLVVGLPLEQYSDLASASPFCGQYVVVTDPRDNTTVTALVADASATNNTLSVSQGTWEALNGTDSALKYVDWRFANQTETEEAKAALEDGSSSSSSSSAPSSSAARASSTSSSAPASSSAAAQNYQVEEKESTTSSKPTTTARAYTTTTSYAPKTTTTTWSSPKAETTQAVATKQAQSYSSGSSSSSGSGSYSGHATFFYQNGNPGACGNYNSDSTYLVALQSSMYNGGSHCGKMVTIYRGGKSIQAKVQDDLDLSVGAFNAIASESEGQVDITWSWSSDN